MIGVIAKPHQRGAVEELFELFKTPWEFCRRDEPYDAVITTTGEIPDAGARLVVVSGPARSPLDAVDGVVRTAPQPGGVIPYAGMRVPLYGPVARLRRTTGTRDGATTARVLGAPGRLHLGYDLFDEVAHLLTQGQPAAHASIPTLDVHIAMLRESMLGAGIPVVEIPPVPAGRGGIACLTHDIDFAGIRYHRCDHTMWGFLSRATLGALRRFLRGRMGARDVARSWRAAATLPLVHAGLARDFWEPFPWYLAAENGRPSTYFFIPYKGRAGERVAGRHASRRRAAYDVNELHDWTRALRSAGCEVAVHGIDAWHSVERACAERERVSRAGGGDVTGMRVHWLLSDTTTPRVLDEAGYDYDSSLGYNDTVGFRNGTAQVFRPTGAARLLELPLHIQDGALFFPGRLDLGETQGWQRCQQIVDRVSALGAVVTVLWHDRSFAPDRLWGQFYLRLLDDLTARNAWFATASDVVAWFRTRRRVGFSRSAHGETLRVHAAGEVPDRCPPLRVRVWRRDADDRDHVVDRAWTGSDDVIIDRSRAPAALA